MGKGGLVPAGELLVLAQFAGQTVAAAAVTDAWESARGKFARLLGRGDARRTDAAAGWLAEARDLLTAPGGDTEAARAGMAQRWAGRFADLLDEDPGAAVGLRALADEVAARIPAAVVSAAGHSAAAGRDMTITASGGAWRPGCCTGT
jgi:hypothetical protein